MMRLGDPEPIFNNIMSFVSCPAGPRRFRLGPVVVLGGVGGGLGYHREKSERFGRARARHRQIAAALRS